MVWGRGGRIGNARSYAILCLHSQTRTHYLYKNCTLSLIMMMLLLLLSQSLSEKCKDFNVGQARSFNLANSSKHACLPAYVLASLLALKLKHFYTDRPTYSLTDIVVCLLIRLLVVSSLLSVVAAVVKCI